MAEDEQMGPEGQDFQARELDPSDMAEQADSSESEQSREQREAEIDRRFFEESKQQYEKELEHATTCLEESRAALERTSADEFHRAEAVEFFKSRISMWEEIQGIAQAGIDRANAGLARLDAAK